MGILINSVRMDILLGFINCVMERRSVSPLVEQMILRGKLGSETARASWFLLSELQCCSVQILLLFNSQRLRFAAVSIETDA